MNSYKAYRICLEENKRSKKLEKIIIEDPQWSYFYALNVIKGRWDEGEDTISKDPKWSYYYATVVIDEHFKKSNDIIFNSEYKKKYIKFLKRKKHDMIEISEWLI